MKKDTIRFLKILIFFSFFYGQNYLLAKSDYFNNICYLKINSIFKTKNLQNKKDYLYINAELDKKPQAFQYSANKTINTKIIKGELTKEEIIFFYGRSSYDSYESCKGIDNFQIREMCLESFL